MTQNSVFSVPQPHLFGLAVIFMTYAVESVK